MAEYFCLQLFSFTLLNKINQNSTSLCLLYPFELWHMRKFIFFHIYFLFYVTLELCGLFLTDNLIFDQEVLMFRKLNCWLVSAPSHAEQTGRFKMGE